MLFTFDGYFYFFGVFRDYVEFHAPVELRFGPGGYRFVAEFA